MGMCEAGLPSSDSADLANDAKTFHSFHQFSAKPATLYTQLTLQTTFNAITQDILEVEIVFLVTMQICLGLFPHFAADSAF